MGPESAGGLPVAGHDNAGEPPAVPNRANVPLN